jgi:Coenzyme PQQ synthesis protein D (PqqD)
MMARNLDQRIQRDPRVVWRAFETETAIMDPWVGSVHTVTEVGARCWELADGRTLQEIIDVLLEEFEVEPDVLRADLEEFLDELDQRKLLERTT